MCYVLLREYNRVWRFIVQLRVWSGDFYQIYEPVFIKKLVNFF